MLRGLQLTSLQLQLARYLFRFEPSDGNLYRKLGKRIKSYERTTGMRWNGAFATLNYDRLLQLALTVTSVPFSLSGPMGPGFEICAPHGLCNLFSGTVRYERNFSASERPAIIFADHTSTLEGDAPPVLIRSQEEFDTVAKYGLPPIMSYYEGEKLSSIHMEWLHMHRNRFHELVRHAGKIAIVGMRVHEVDLHIWEPLAMTSAKLLYCSGDGGEFSAWQTRVGRRPESDELLTGMYFRDGFETILKFLDLS